MTKPVTIPNTFATATTAIPLSNLDADFSTVATALNDANTYSNYAPDTGSANAYVVTLSGVSTTYSAGLRIQFKAGNANTTASTLNVNGGGAKNITYQDATAIASGTIAANSIVDVMYDGTQFLLMNDPAGATGGDVVGPSSATDNAIVRFDGTTGKLVQNSVVTIADSTGDISGVGQLNATTVDATNIEVTNIKAKDGTAAGSIADSTGVVSFTANPVMSGGTANGVLYLNGSKVATSGSALTFDGTNLSPGSFSQNLGTTAARWGTVYATALSDGTDQLVGSVSTTARFGYGAGWTALAFAIGGSEGMRLTSTGLGIGTSSPANKLHIQKASGGSGGYLKVTDAVYGGDVRFGMADGVDNDAVAGVWSNNNFKFYTNSTERARITTGGDFVVGYTVAGAYDTTSFSYSPAIKSTDTNHATGASSGDNYARFNYAGGTIGSITQNGTTGVLYNITSDYRLKTVTGPVSNAGLRIDALEPVEYTWKSDGATARGFLAHQFQEVYPNSVTGEKDAVDADGKPVYQNMQASTSEVIADLVAEIKSLRQRVAQLEGTQP